MSVWKSLKDKEVVNRFEEEQLYAIALEEMQSGRRRDGLWAKALAESNGDERIAKAKYIKLLVLALRDDSYIEQRRNEDIATSGEAAGSESQQSEPSIERVRSGQKLIIYALLVGLCALPAQSAFGDWGLLLNLLSLALSLIGLIQLTSGLNYRTLSKIALAALLLVPLLNLVVLVFLSSKATSALRAAGFKVGLLGAR